MILPLKRIRSCPNSVIRSGWGTPAARTANIRGSTGAVRRPQDAPGATNAGVGDCQAVWVLFGILGANLAMHSLDADVAVVGLARPGWAQRERQAVGWWWPERKQRTYVNPMNPNKGVMSDSANEDKGLTSNTPMHKNVIGTS